MDLNGVHLFVLCGQMDEILRQGDMREVPGLDAFIIGPLDKGLPLRIINVTGRISKKIGRLITTVFGKLCCFRIFLIIATRLDPTVEDLCGTEDVECWGCIGTVLRWSALWHYGRTKAEL